MLLGHITLQQVCNEVRRGDSTMMTIPDLRGVRGSL